MVDAENDSTFDAPEDHVMSRLRAIDRLRTVSDPDIIGAQIREHTRRRPTNQTKRPYEHWSQKIETITALLFDLGSVWHNTPSPFHFSA